MDKGVKGDACLRPAFLERMVRMNKYIVKIESQIAALDKKIDALSGNYLTNTRKRQNEQRERDRKKDQFHRYKQLLEYLLPRAQGNTLTPLEMALTVGTFYEDMCCLSKTKAYCDASSGKEFEYPHWCVAQIRRLQKANLRTKAELIEAIAQFDRLMAQVTEPKDQAAEILRDLVFQARLYQSGDIQFTPDALAGHLVELSGITKNSRVLEPEAGIGDLADAIRKRTDKVDCIERMYSFREILQLKKHRLISDDLMATQAAPVYDAVIMNPPFSSECEHIRKAFDFVCPGGKLLAICSNRITWKQQKEYEQFRDWLSQHTHSVMDTPDVKFDHTQTPTVILQIQKAA